MKSFTKGRRSIAAVAAGAVAFGLMTAGGTAAHADIAPGTGDIVGVGSDTLQYMLDFGADGDFNGNGGYNVGKSQRIFSFDATPDANARAGYLNGSSSTALKALNPSIVLRAGAQPRERPNGSGAGITALSFDTAGSINFARSSSPLSGAQVTAATGTGGVGDLHEVRLAHDSINIATASTGGGSVTHAVPLSTDQLKHIYACDTGFTNWNDTGIGGTSTDAIIPVLPQAGSGTRKTFLGDIGDLDANGNEISGALGACVKIYEENDPYALYLANDGTQVSDPYATAAVANPDAIEPMSAGRLNLYNSGYFYNPNVAIGKAPAAGDEGTLTPKVSLITTGTPHTGAVYNDKRGLYVIFREADITSGAHFNGATKNWVNTLFLAGSSGGTPYFEGAAGQALLASAGVTPDYSDCGKDPTSATPCGDFVG
jgi:ABC-type phosphate transport system substrate-binding protein